ncbi:aspartate carbamoyltransferase [Candidatus Marinamargulisbacteria bacterium SCGC AAA071-K20]|nr:aspartate carbamoyltransferase [Candidatus Marinamargulisbacteria bacterium SCGC AAA071-K20]
MDNPFLGQDIINSVSFSKDVLDFLNTYTQKIEKAYQKEQGLDLLKNRILASLFFEPSTRTRLSFETAMIRMGGQIITVEQPMMSSISKGESLEDTAETVSRFADIIALRHPMAHSSELFAKHSAAPVMNCGDGSNEHPTQALLDLYTINKEKNLNSRDTPLKVGFIGDLKYGRTVHSLSKVLRHYNSQMVFISKPNLKVPESVKSCLKDCKYRFDEVENLFDVIGDLDVLYVTRIQKERFENEDAYNLARNDYLIDQSVLDKSKSDLSILHPLPRVDEIDPRIDEDPRVCFFKQVENGVFLRMALLSLVLGKTL